MSINHELHVSSSAALWNSSISPVSLQHLVDDSRTQSIISWLFPRPFLLLPFGLRRTYRVTNSDYRRTSFISPAQLWFLCSMQDWLWRSSNLGENNRAVIILSDGTCLKKVLYMFNSLHAPTLFPFSIPLAREGFPLGWDVFVICQSNLQPSVSLAHMIALLDFISFNAILVVEYKFKYSFLVEIYTLLSSGCCHQLIFPFPQND